MKQFKKKLLALLTVLVVATCLFARPTEAADTAKVVTFQFVPGNDMFYIPWHGNDAELSRLYSLVDRYRSEITAGRMPLYVDGYCASQPTPAANLHTAYLRANRVKSELITHKGLKEADFITANYATAYKDRKDVVVVTLRLPAEQRPEPSAAVKEEPERRQPVVAVEKPRQKDAEETRREDVAERQAEPRAAAETASQATSREAVPYRFAVRTNLLYDAMLLPTLGVEWRINRSVGIRLDGSLAWWGGSTGKVQKMWLVNPEVRWYLLGNKRLYVGASANYGEYNVYKYLLGDILSKDTGYQGKLWNAGLTVGYQLPLSRHFAVDFNLGLGYTRSEHDSFGVIDGVRVYKERDHTKNFWGPTQAGISLLWTIGANK